MVARGPFPGWTTGDFADLALVKVGLTEALLRAPERVRWRALYELTMQFWPSEERGGLPPPPGEEAQP
jgi:hypothetical protein